VLPRFCEADAVKVASSLTLRVKMLLEPPFSPFEGPDPVASFPSIALSDLASTLSPLFLHLSCPVTVYRLQVRNSYGGIFKERHLKGADNR
jgi:hypothetical protein